MTPNSRIPALAIALLALVCQAAQAKVYYVDRSGGRDSASGTSPEAAWRSLARISIQPLGEGDYVLLKRGEAWAERLVLSARGIEAAPVTIGAYGSGPRPVIEAYARSAGSAMDLVELESCRDVVVEHLEIRNSSRNGVNSFRCTGLTLRDLVVHGSRWNGMLIYDTNRVLVEDCDIYGNGLDLEESYDGIRVDARQRASSIAIRNNRIHGNVGGEHWRSDNGIFIGHTGEPVPALTGVEITGNEIYRNGNPAQNQAGRGVTGTFHGDVTITANHIHDNASAGLYVGDRGDRVNMRILNNTFYNNALRQFGGFTDATAVATGNVVFVDMPDETSMGAEIGGQGQWRIERNAFFYMTGTTDTYRGYIRLNDAAQDHNLVADRNLYFSPTPLPFRKSDGVPITFSVWQASGFDINSRNPLGDGTE